MRRVLPLKIVLASLLVAACVTINVYFPAAAVEKAADQAINEITGAGKSGTATPPQSNLLVPHERPTLGAEAQNLLAAALGHMVDTLIPTANAQGADSLNANSPAITRIKGSMAARFPELEKFFASGAIGLTNNGMIDVRDLNAVGLADRATVKRLVSEDNADRAQLYTEYAKANNHPEWEGDIRKTFARRWIETGAKPGWYYQDESGAWNRSN